MAIEITFSFDNAIINAKVLATMSPAWQRAFMTIGILIAVFGMRVIFPILMVMFTAGLPWGDVLQLALHEPEKYAEELHKAHTSIASFGGMFLLMLCLHFFFDPGCLLRKCLRRIGDDWFFDDHALVRIARGMHRRAGQHNNGKQHDTTKHSTSPGY